MTSRKQLLFLFALVVNGAVASHREWHAFLSQYERAYDNDAEHDARYAIFRRNLALIEAHNAEADLGMHTYRLAVNQFADLTGDEFRIRHKLKRSSASSSAPSAHRLFRLATADDDNDLPKSMDWRSKDMVTPVKDQGMCGSCWSFAATGSMEGAHALAASAADPLRRLTKKPLLSFSEQELVDCVDGGEFTCDTGGIYTEAFEFVIANGTVLESEYRYVNGMDTTKERCRLGASGYNSHPMKFFTKYVTLVSGDENALKRASSEHPGVAVAIDASSDSFQFYSSGVYHSETCSSEDLDHAVLVVGYGTDPVGGDFWLVKNSWSAAWGEHGYIRMARNRGNMCGIATYPAYILAEDAVSHGSAVYVSVM